MTDENWYDGLENEELKFSPVLKTFKSQEDALKGLVELKAYQGRSIALLPEDATPEMRKEWDTKLMEKVPGLVRKPNVDDPDDAKRFWSDLGTPEDRDGYQPPEGFEGLGDDVINDLSIIAHETGMTLEQYHKFLNTYAAANEEVQTAQATRLAEEEAELKKTWGAAYEDNIKISDTISAKFNGGEPVENMSNAERVRWINAAKALSSDPQVFNQISNPSPRKTRAEVQDRIDQIRTLLLDKSVHGDKRKALLKEQNNLWDELA